METLSDEIFKALKTKFVYLERSKLYLTIK